MPRLDQESVARVGEFVSRLLYFDEPATRRRIVKEALVLWQPDSVPKRFYERVLKVSERRVAAWPPGLFLQLQIMQLAEVEQVAQEEDHLAGRRLLPESVFVERFVQKLIVASMAIPREGGGKAAGRRQRREARNVYTLCVALCQVLRDYTSGQVGVIYQAATQASQPADDRSDNAHSATKLKVMKALLDRFGEFIREERTPRGERRFERQESQRQARWQPVVKDTLSYLRPWGVRHVLEKPHNPEEGLPELTVSRGLTKGSWQVLANCAHVLICPSCFVKLVANLHRLLGHIDEPLPSPDDVLAVPKFYEQSDEQSSADPPPSPPGAQESREVDDLKLTLEIHDERDRIRKKRTSRLAVVVDNLPPFEHDLVSGGAEFEFVLPGKATYLRIYSRDYEGDLLLAGASIRRAWYGGEIIRESLVGLGGQTVELLVTPHSGEGASSAGARVQLKYHETFLGKRLLSGLERTRHRWASAYAARPYRFAAGVALSVAAGVVLFIAAAAILTAIVRSLRPQSPRHSTEISVTTKSPEAPSATPPPTPEGRLVEDQPTNTPPPDGGRPDKHPTEPEIAQHLPPRNARPLEPYDRGTRGLSVAESRKYLREVKEVFVRVEGPKELADRVRPAAEAALSVTTVVLTAGGESAADAHLIIRLTSDGQSATATARLINREGKVLWPVKAPPPIKKNTAAVEEIGKEVGTALSDEIKKAASGGGP